MKQRIDFRTVRELPGLNHPDFEKQEDAFADQLSDIGRRRSNLGLGRVYTRQMAKSHKPDLRTMQKGALYQLWERGKHRGAIDPSTALIQFEREQEAKARARQIQPKEETPAQMDARVSARAIAKFESLFGGRA